MHPSATCPGWPGAVKPSARPLVWLRSWRIVIWSPLGTPVDPLGDVVVEGDLALADQLQDEVGRERLGLAGDLELHVRLQGLPGGEVGDTGRADEVPFGLQMPIRTPGRAVRLWNRRTICSTCARVRAGRGPLAVSARERAAVSLPLDPNADAAPSNTPTTTRAPMRRAYLPELTRRPSCRQGARTTRACHGRG